MKSFSFPISHLTPEQVRSSRIKIHTTRNITMEEYYAIEDSTNSLERLRQYQWRDFLGRYKIF